MPADDHPFDALEKQLQMEDVFLSPVTGVVLRILEASPTPWPFNKAVEMIRGRLSLDSTERIRLMLETCMAEVRRHDSLINELYDRMNADGQRAREEATKELVLDAARKAEGTRAKERVRRIGHILANAIVEPNPADADEAEEMMRIAVDLSDNDVKFLRELIRIEGDVLQNQKYIPLYDARQRWEQGFWGTGIDPAIDSVFSKLESFGLVVRIAPPNTLNAMADYQNRYVLLKKGARFAALIRQSA